MLAILRKKSLKGVAFFRLISAFFLAAASLTSAPSSAYTSFEKAAVT